MSLLSQPLRDVEPASSILPPEVTYSRKVFIPLTQLCRDACGYCTFAKAPRRLAVPYLSLDQVLDIARAGAAAGCKEALFTLGDKPELRYRQARQALEAMGFDSTVSYLRAAAAAVMAETDLLPHINAGVLEAADYALLRPVAASMGMMLESTADRLCERGGPHFAAPDKRPSVRLASIAEAGRARIPFTSGLLIGIGETEAERIDALTALRDLHREFGHIQEVIIQNFRAKPGTRMRDVPDCDEDTLLGTIRLAREILDPEIVVQCPPNLNPGLTAALLGAGVGDWGGISPVTIDHVNPERPWPQLDDLEAECARAGYRLVERLTVYPRYVGDPSSWIDDRVRSHVLRQADAHGLAREEGWCPGAPEPVPIAGRSLVSAAPAIAGQSGMTLTRRIQRTTRGLASEAEIAELFAARGEQAEEIIAAADALRQAVNGDTVTYVINRNINYTNICTYRCGFCAFSKSSSRDTARDTPYDLPLEEIQARTREAWRQGATEVCLQGGIHPRYTGQTYLDVCRAVKEAVPDIHVHAFSPLEVSHGASSLGVSVGDFLMRLKDEGLGSLPGTAAEILDDDVRRIICPDKLTAAQWSDVVRTAHGLGIPTTSTIMFGHVDGPRHWARHLLDIRRIQLDTGGFTEFVPLPFVHMRAPIYVRGLSRRGPTWREVLLMHAIARLALHGAVHSIQASWVKLGLEGAASLLEAGVNDLGGVLMNESITRAAGATHGQSHAATDFLAAAAAIGRPARQRTTLYGEPKSPRWSDDGDGARTDRELRETAID